MTATATATPTKLRDGSWGARTSLPVAIGDTITIITRSGKAWQALVTQVITSTAGGASIVATGSLDRPAAAPGRCRTARCHHVATSTGYCRSCEHDA